MKWNRNCNSPVSLTLARVYSFDRFLPCPLVGLSTFPLKDARPAAASVVCDFYVSQAALKVPASCTLEGDLRSSRSEYGNGVSWSAANESCLLPASGESPRLTDSDHISAAVGGGRHDCCYPFVCETGGAGHTRAHTPTRTNQCQYLCKVLRLTHSFPSN